MPISKRVYHLSEGFVSVSTSLVLHIFRNHAAGFSNYFKTLRHIPFTQGFTIQRKDYFTAPVLLV